MKYVKQFLIILLISLIGEGLKYLLPLPIPASIYGMVLMFAALKCGIIKLASVKETAHFLIDIMPIMFIPAGVGLMDSVGTLRSILVPVLIITVVTNITVMGATGRVAQGIIRAGEKKSKAAAAAEKARAVADDRKNEGGSVKDAACKDRDSRNGKEDIH